MFRSVLSRKYLIISIIATALLSSCSLPGTQSESSKTTILYTGSGISMEVPKTWTESTGALSLNPKKWMIELALISPDVKYGFSNNLIIMRDELNGLTTSRQYSELNYVQTLRHYLESARVKDESIIFDDTDESHVYVFTAKYNPNTPRLQFIQTAKVCGTTVHFVHFSLALDKDPGAYIPLLRTLTCK